MRIIIKKIILAFSFIFILTLCFAKSGNAELSANENVEGKAYGFSIDEDAFNVTWNEKKEVSAKYNGVKIGTTEIYQGKAISKKLVQGKYAITYLTAVKTCPQEAQYSEKVLWKRKYWSEYGYNSKCELSASLAYGSNLLSSTPKYSVEDTSYSVGIQAGVDTSGPSGAISGSVNYTDEAIDITNYSSTSNKKVDIRINLNESIWRLDWKRYKYAEQENIQLFTFTVLTYYNNVKQNISIYTRYGTMNSHARFWMDTCSHYASCTANVTI
jgi:hypothetical protein